MNKNYVYFDNAASTRVDEKVVEAMKPYFLKKYAVATSEFAYRMGIETKEALDSARRTLAKKLGARSEEIIFTSGSTESSNLAIKGAAAAASEHGKHIVTSKIEDFPVLHSVETLEKQGFDATYLDVDDQGFIDPRDLENAIRSDTVLVSLQHANQEIGTLQDIEKIAAITNDHDILFHADATHTFSRVPLNVREIPVDMLTLSAHTIHGPKGIGALYVRNGTAIEKQMDGGFQENNLRPGIQNVPGAIGFAKAVNLVSEEENERLKQMRDALIEEVLSTIPDTSLNGPHKERIPQNANITFHYVEGESITLHMDMRGFAVSTGSACFSKSLEASHVLMATSGSHERAHGSVRFTFGRFNTIEEVDQAVKAVSEVVKRLREISPLGKEKEG